MPSQITIEQVADEVREIYRSDREHADSRIELYLTGRLKSLPEKEKPLYVKKLRDAFKTTGRGAATAREKELISRFLSLLLKKEVFLADYSSEDLLEKLAEGLNTVFDSLNQLVRVIHGSLLGQSTEDGTIRQIIASNLNDKHDFASIESYLEHIKTAFFMAQQAFTKAAETKIGEILLELDPSRISSPATAWFGPLRKSKHDALYKDKFDRCKTYFESGKFKQDYLREVERICQKMLTSRMRS